MVTHFLSFLFCPYFPSLLSLHSLLFWCVLTGLCVYLEARDLSSGTVYLSVIWDRPSEWSGDHQVAMLAAQLAPEIHLFLPPQHCASSFLWVLSIELRSSCLDDKHGLDWTLVLQVWALCWLNISENHTHFSFNLGHCFKTFILLIHYSAF